MAADAKGYQVKTVDINPLHPELVQPDHFEFIQADLFKMSDQEIINILADCQGFIYAGGVDERIVPQYPAHKFFYEQNVLPTQRLARLARQAGVTSFVVFGSYYSQVAQDRPEIGIQQYPYVNTRLLQEQVAMAEGYDQMAVSVLRLPRIYGTMPGKIPLWKMFTDVVRGQDYYPAATGVHPYITAKQVGQAAISALELADHRTCYACATGQHSDQQYLLWTLEALGQVKTTRLEVVPYVDQKSQLEALDQASYDQGLEHGMPIAVSGYLNSLDLSLDPEESIKTLQLIPENGQAVIKETLAETD
ncbi:hypothetical protein AWM75_00670 [Aerococcus urinaehominis]|uniref:Uncharacterized protein n=1 Tax=Aerococcus urinaehominis TaxID=128944 RepID=A0A0X8FJR3_9LACT|nr:NAD-dependent epimerase/dehydratase family protein [Aerococcus urinaehominis]AMB98594.1 hypothetical protein AWM75_00670 [Aerococcus urinaehominis]SDL76484.1 Nucleoside-diphosphate-sugar epimerase [Aerococcus urinaehominis]